MNNVADLLSQLDNLNQQTSVSVFIPSLKRFIKFKPLNLKQQKNLLKSSVEETFVKFSFLTNFYSIIQENILEPIDINQFYIFDRTAIAIALRSATIDTKYIIGDNTYDLQNKINEYQNITINDSDINSTVEIQNLSIALEVPRIGIDRDTNVALLNKTSASDDMKEIIGELFIYEIFKFIKLVTFKSEKGDNTVQFSNLKIEEKLAIAEKFPTTITNQILEFIKKYRDFEYKYTKIDDGFISVDGEFFTI